MKSLLKADFRRILKDKLLIVMGILAVAFAAFTPLLYALMFSSMDAMDDALLSSFVSAKSHFFNAFSIGNNVGLIAPVLLAIALCKDFSYGTVRNKIISGKSRSQIFLSLFITCSVIFIAVMLLHAFVTLGISLIFFDYQADPFTLGDFGYFMASLGMSLLILLFVAALLSWLCACMKNVGLVIVLYIAFNFLLALVSSILMVVIPILEATGGSQNTIDILTFINRINVANAISYIGVLDSYTLDDVLYLTLPSLIGILGFLSLGLWGFNKKDLK